MKKLRISILEKIIFEYENTPMQSNGETYELAREEYDQITTEITNGQILRSKTVNYQSSEKHSKYFFNLEKKELKIVQLNVCVQILTVK